MHRRRSARILASHMAYDERPSRNEQVRGSIPRPGSTPKHVLTRQDAEIVVEVLLHSGDDFGKRDTLVTQEPRIAGI